jgi:hypothetical protein
MKAPDPANSFAIAELAIGAIVNVVIVDSAIASAWSQITPLGYIEDDQIVS